MSGLENRKYVLQVEYDFSKDGGAVGDITLRGGGLPTGAVINSGIVDIITDCTSSGSATVAIKVESAADVMGATAVASLTAGQLNVDPDSTDATTAIKTTTTRNVVATIGTAALTAGNFVVCLDYYITS